MRLNVAILVILLVSVGCATFPQAFDGDGPINKNHAGIAIKGYDPVAYFTKGHPEKGKPHIESEYKGAVFRFSSQKHKSLFDRNPKKYLPAYGGFCSLGVAGEYKDTIDPYAFEIVDGRLFLNLNKDVHAFWKRNREAFILRGDVTWPTLKNAPGHGPRDGR